MCKQCSSDRGYALYLGSPLLMGMEGIKDGKFSEADQRFAHILMFDQVNIDAHRGRILCAGKWKSFQGIELSDNLSEVDWQLVQLRVDESIKRSTDRSRYYYDLIKETISLLKQYSDVLVMLQIDPDNTKYQQEKETLSREFQGETRQLRREGPCRKGSGPRAGQSVHD